MYAKFRELALCQNLIAKILLHICTYVYDMYIHQSEDKFKYLIIKKHTHRRIVDIALPIGDT